MRDDLRPAPHIGQPGDRAIGSEYHVELIVDGGRRVVEVGADEMGGKFEFIADRACELDCLIGEVEARDRRTEPRPWQGIEPEVTLQMKQRPRLRSFCMLNVAAIRIVPEGGIPRGYQVPGDCFFLRRASLPDVEEMVIAAVL
jgi:hypothetical protein